MAVIEHNARMVRIYGLVDPRSGAIRYVGQSGKRYLCNRLADHVHRRDQTPKSQWVQELIGAGLRPRIVELECVCSVFGDEAEGRWIDKLQKEHGDLLNRRGGGNGPLSASSKAKMSQSRAAFRGWKHSLETRAKIGRDGEQNSNAKLTAAIVRVVRSRFADGEAQVAITRSLSLTPQAVNAIVLRRVWKSVT